MKKCYSLPRWPLLITGCAQQTFTVQNKNRAAETVKPIFVSGIGQKKTVDAAKICGGAENVVKTENPANIRKWIVSGFITFRAFILRWKRVCIAHNNCMSYPSIWATSICTVITTFSCFCIVISLSLRVK